MLPQLDRVETVTHQVGRLEQEFLALVALLLRQLRIVVAQRQAAEGDVAGLVLHDVGIHLGAELVLGVVADGGERREREALDHHLHAEIGHVPARIPSVWSISSLRGFVIG